MKSMSKYIVVLLCSMLIVLSSCSVIENTQEIINENNTKVKEEVNNEDPKESKVYEEVVQANTYDTIENTLISLNNIGGRLISTEGNNKFIEELKEYMSASFLGIELFLQPYNFSLTDEFIVNIQSGSEAVVTFSNNDALCKFINKGYLTEAAYVTNTLENLDSSKKYILITEDETQVESSKKYQNICLSLLGVDKVYLLQNVIKVNTNYPTIINIEKPILEKLDSLVGESVDLKIDILNKEIELQNVFATIKGKESNNAIVITSHLDTTTALGNNYSKGAIDNGSGVALNLDLLRKVYKEGNSSNYDLIFAFVNSEEGFLLKSSSGSMQLNNLLSQKYDNMLNINVDCLGEKDINILSYGFDGNINGDLISNIIISQEKGSFTLEKSEYYTSDNMNFDNSIYFYNFDYHGENRAIHTENDTIEMINIDNLEFISSFIYNVLIEILEIDSNSLF